MNIKPTPEQVDNWELKAAQCADSQTGEYYEYQQAKNEKFAELAAQWGAAQAQQTTIEEPELPEPVVAREEYAVGTGEFYTATQMREHYAAGVRAGAAGSQWQPIDSAPQDGTKVLAYTNDGYKYPLVCQCVWGDGAWWPDVWESPDEPLSQTHCMPLPAAPEEQKQ